MKYLLLPILFLFHLTTAANSNHEEDLANRLRHHVSHLASDTLQGRGLGTRGIDIAREYIAAQFSAADLKLFDDDYFQHFETRIGLAWVPAMNIVGYLEGTDPLLKDEYIVIGAHYDHLGYTKSNDRKTIFPGADDNASGVAGVIELARHFSENRGEIKRSLIFVAFDAEESGLLGSKHFVENCPVPIQQVKTMFSLDMIGMYDSNGGVRLNGLATLQGGPEIAGRLASDMNLTIRSANNRIERRTDTAPFGDRGIPSIHVFTGTKSPYHKPQDTPDLLEYEGMARVVRFLKALTGELASAEELSATPAFTTAILKKEAGKTPMGFGFIMNAGSGHHRYKDEFFRANLAFSAGAGFFATIPAGRTFAIQPEAFYELNGSEIAGGTFRRHSVTIPLHLRLSTPASEFGPMAFVFAGPYYRYSFGGKSAGQPIDFENIFEPTEYGVSFGFGFQVFKIQMRFTSRYGLNSIFQGTDPKVFDTAYLFGIGYQF